MMDRIDKKFRVFADNLKEGVAFHEFVYDDRGKPIDYRIVDVNAQYEKIIGISAATAKGKLATELYGMPEPPYGDVYHEVVRQQKSTQFDVFFPPLDKDFLITAIPWGKTGFVTVFTESFRDDYLDCEPHMKAGEMGLIDLRKQIIRLSEELHDDVCQELVALCYRTDSLLALPEIKSSAKGRAAGLKIRAKATQILKMTRAVAHGLLETKGQKKSLRDRLQVLAKKTEERFKIPCKCLVKLGPASLDHSFSFHLFKIAQEAVINAVKHAQPKRIWIESKYIQKQLMLTIVNDGAPFAESIDVERSLGIRLMQYHARRVGGTLNFEKPPKGGTVVKFSVLESKMQSRGKQAARSK